ncbi:MAG: Holliday junction branch migration DNA helicase RuvB, partial [Chloroflexota bacterium]
MAIQRSSDSKSSSPKKPRAPKKEVDPTLMLASANSEETEQNEDKIRPQRLEDYIGQKDLKGILNIAIAAAKGRQDSLDHLLLYGPPGLGKTTMSLILA